MATRYFKNLNEREVCATSSGNRSKVRPDAPGYSYDWIEIDRKEFIKLRRKIVSGTTTRAADLLDSSAKSALVAQPAPVDDF